MKVETQFNADANLAACSDVNDCGWHEVTIDFPEARRKASLHAEETGHQTLACVTSSITYRMTNNTDNNDNDTEENDNA